MRKFNIYGLYDTFICCLYHDSRRRMVQTRQTLSINIFSKHYYSPLGFVFFRVDIGFQEETETHYDN